MPSFRVSLSALIGTAALLCGCITKAPELLTVSLGEKVQAGALSYSAFDTQWLMSLGEGPNMRTPVNRFFIVHLNVVNGGRGDINVPTFMLVDASGQTFNELSNGDGVPNWMGVARKLRPGDADNGNIAFDVAPKHYRLRVADESEEHFAYIDIPLNFGTPPPNLAPPSPGDALPGAPSVKR